MSLITRCPACGTMFKVVTDQLKVSQGWVRCGQCSEVFDASVHLLPRDRVGQESSVLVAERQPEVGPSPEPAEAPLTPTSAPPQAAWAPATSVADRGGATPAESGRAEVMPEAQDSAADFDPLSWKRSQQARQLPEVEAVPLAAPVADTPPRRPELVRTATVVDEAEASDFAPSGAGDSAMADDGAEVSFVRDARRKAFWKKPLARWSLGVLSLLLLAVLALQWVMQQKDSLAAWEPRLVPVLQVLCGPLRCELRPPRHIESLVIDSSSFNKISPDGYRLSFALKSTSAMALEMPSLEVTLTDAQDQALVRRVLGPAEFGAKTATLAAHAELAGVVLMKVSGDEGRAAASSPSSSVPAAPLRVAGYRVLAFYP